MTRNHLEETGAVSVKESNQSMLLSALLASLEDFAFLLNLEGRYLYSNKPQINLFGKTLDVVLGKTFFELDYPRELTSQIKVQFQETVDSGKSMRGEAVYSASKNVTEH